MNYETNKTFLSKLDEALYLNEKILRCWLHYGKKTSGIQKLSLCYIEIMGQFIIYYIEIMGQFIIYYIEIMCKFKQKFKFK